MDSRQVTINDFATIRMLGSGFYGQVSLSRMIRHGSDCGQLYAIKSIKKTILINNWKLLSCHEQSVLEEARDCPFVCKLHYSFHTPDRLFLVLDYAPGGDLLSHLLDKHRRFSSCEVRFYMTELVVALSALHERRIMHRDIKLENIMIDSKGHVLLVDFGLGKMFGESQLHCTTYSFCGTPEYMAPEVIEKDRSYSFSADWWSLGIVAYELLSGHAPFEIAGMDNSIPSIQRRILHQRYMPLLPTIPTQAKHFVSSLLVKDPAKRLGNGGADEVRQHPFFEGVNWSDVANKLTEVPWKPLLFDFEAQQQGPMAMLSTSTGENLKIDPFESFSSCKSATDDAKQRPIFEGINWNDVANKLLNEAPRKPLLVDVKPQPQSRESISAIESLLKDLASDQFEAFPCSSPGESSSVETTLTTVDSGCAGDNSCDLSINSSGSADASDNTNSPVKSPIKATVGASWSPR